MSASPGPAWRSIRRPAALPHTIVNKRPRSWQRVCWWPPRRRFRKTHDLDELADLAVSNYPECRNLLDATRPLTVWGVAYHYPGTEDIAEPVPDQVTLRRTIDLIERLGERLQATAAAGDPGAYH